MTFNNFAIFSRIINCVQYRSLNAVICQIINPQLKQQATNKAGFTLKRVQVSLHRLARVALYHKQSYVILRAP